MKKTLILLIIILFFGLSNAQEKKIKFSAYTTWDYSNIPPSDLIDHRGKLAFGFGLQANYEISKKFEIVTAIAYIDKGYNEKTTGFGADDGIVTRITPWRSTYLSIPIKVQYNLLNDKWKFYIAGGIENDFHLSGNGIYIYEDFAQSITFNLGVNTLISEKFSLGVEPTYRSSIQTYGIYNGGVRPELNPYSFGLKVLITKVK